MDIDIDTPTDFDPKRIFPNIVTASMVKDGELKKHPVGVYFQNAPTDPVTNLAAIPYEQADRVGLMKVDFLHLSTLDSFNSKDEIRRLLKQPPNWEMLLDPDIVGQLFQIKNHFDVINAVRPTSTIELADCIALIRPGKRFLLDMYLKNKEKTRIEIYKKTDKYYFKKGHAISYAYTIILQMHAIEKQGSNNTDALFEF